MKTDPRTFQDIRRAVAKGKDRLAIAGSIFSHERVTLRALCDALDNMTTDEKMKIIHAVNKELDE